MKYAKIQSLFLFLIYALLPAAQAYAACASPVGAAGEIEYFSSDKMYRYCDDTDWIDMSGAPVSGLVVHLKFDDGSGSSTAADSSGNGNDGSLLSMDTSADWITGKVGSGAITLDSTDDEVNVANDTSLDFGTGDFTVSAWLNPPTLTDSRYLLTKHTGTSGFRFGYAATSGRLYSLIGDGTNDAGLSTSGISAGTWSMATIVFDRDVGARYYINGSYDSQDTTITARTGSINSTQALRLWPRILSSDENVYDDLRVYNRALSDAEVTNLYNSTSGNGSCTTAGEMSYDSTNDVMVWCNGSDKSTMGPATGAGGGGCSTPTASAGALNYDTSTNTMQYCDGAAWVDIGK